MKLSVSLNPLQPIAAPPPVDEDLTDLLVAWQAGQSDVREELFDRIYARLVRLAGSLISKQGNDISLQAAELVHEAYLRLLDQRRTNWQNRNHFFAIAGRLLRRALVDHLRQRRALKRGGGLPAVTLEGVLSSSAQAEQLTPVDLLGLDRALEELQEIDSLAAQIVELRFFAGLELTEVAEVLEVGRSTVVRRWRYARAWLQTALDAPVPSENEREE
ncbi:MAG: sigma-70 family RNA polymerase sigma factor [Thermoanaerobaculia bacterium]|nr:sigma-70 family RNA polymerase sigma factor [Thermoanaerobaculia bacterium]